MDFCHKGLFWGLCLMAFLTPLVISPVNSESAVLVKMVFVEIGMVILFVLWLIRSAETNQFNLSLPPVTLSVLAFLVIAGLSLTQAVDLRGGIKTYFHLWAMGLLFFLVLQRVRGLDDVKTLTLAMVLPGGLVSLYGILQNFGIDFIPWNVGKEMLGGGPSTLGNRNFSAEYLLSILPLAFALLSLEKRAFRRLLLLFISVLLVFHLLINRTAGGWLGGLVALGSGAFLWAWHKDDSKGKRKNLMALAFLVLWVTSLFFLIFVSPWMGEFALYSSSVLERLNTWHSALGLIKANPSLGVGLGNYWHQVTPFWTKKELQDFSRENRASYFVHNDYLELGTQTGLIGIGAFFLIMAFFFATAWNNLKKGPSSRPLTIAFMATWLGSMAHAFFSSNFLKPAPAFNLWLILALNQVVAYSVRGEEVSKAPFVRPTSSTLSQLKYMALWALAMLTLVFLPLLLVRPLLADMYYKKGLDRQGEERFEESIKAFETSLEIWPGDVYCLFSTGMAYGQSEKYQQAIDYYKKCLERAPLYLIARSNLGFMYFRNGQYAKAISELKEVVNRNPYHYKAYNTLGLCYLKEGKAQEAIEVLKESLRVNFKDPLIHRNLGLAHAMNQEPEEAQREFSLCIAMAPQEPNMYFTLGTFLLSLDKKEEAMAQFQECLKVRPTFAPAHLELAKYLFEGGQVALASYHLSQFSLYRLDQKEEGLALARNLEKIISTIEVPQAQEAAFAAILYNLGLTFASLEQPNKAIELYAKVLQYSLPLELAVASRVNLARVLSEEGKDERAEDLFQEALKLSPQLPEIHRELGLFYRKRGEKEKAAHELKEALRLGLKDEGLVNLLKELER